MERVIKFRAKRADSGEWVYGYYMAVAGTHKILTSNPDSASGATYYDVDASTVGQFTGLEDKNGKEIFEDDILKFDIGRDDVPLEVAVFRNGRFVTVDLQRPYRDDAICCFKDSIAVVGNIHDNQEMLKV